MVLNEGDKRGRRELGRRLSTFLTGTIHHLALKRETFSERTTKFFCIILEVTVVAVRFQGCGGVEDVMHVVIPLGCVVDWFAAVVSSQSRRLIVFILKYEMN